MYFKKENVNLSEEENPLRLSAVLNQLQDLQSEQYAEQYHQQSHAPSQIQNQDTSFLAAAKYQHKVLSQINIKFDVSRVQSNGSEIGPFFQYLNSSSKHLSDYEDESSEDRLSENEIFFLLN
ncbi:15052_t:CDS:2, partial [Cetraspora pellucida]